MKSEMTSTFERILSIYGAGFRQKTDYTCGPASLSLVTQALGIEAIDESDWLAPRLSRWLNLTEFSSRGISLQELFIIAEIILRDRAVVSLHRAYPEFKELFRRDLNEATSGKTAVIMNFAQDHVLGDQGGWQGNPHYSPVAGFDQRKDSVMIADVDKELREPYWTTVSAVFDAMALQNPAFQMPRGWLVIRAREANGEETQS